LSNTTSKLHTAVMLWVQNDQNISYSVCKVCNCFIPTSNSNVSLFNDTIDNYRKCSGVGNVTVNFTKISHLRKLYTFPSSTALYHLRT
jgi:hypothetical protein